jgi:hypothetical protein
MTEPAGSATLSEAGEARSGLNSPRQGPSGGHVADRESQME